MRASRKADVLVLGGGPVGSTAATLLARDGFSVVVLESERHPRFHLGESLLPHVLPVLDRLGVHDQIRALPGTILKPGATFLTRDGDLHLPIRFAEGMPPVVPYAYNVRRDEFDAVLLRNAEAAGADVREEWKAVRPLWEGDRLVGVEARDPGDTTVELRAALTLDATGQSAFLATRMGWKKAYAGHRKLACASHFEGVELPGGDETGNITIVVTDAGWFWLIPFGDGTASVGVVLDAESWKRVGGDPAARFDAVLEATPEAARRLASAKRLRPFASAQNFSFGVRRIHGDGFALVGDAAGFLDPIFSTGIFLGASGAVRAAADAARTLRRKGRVDAPDLANTARETRELHRLGFSLIRAYYDPHFLAVFFRPRPALDIPRAVISVLAGDLLRPDRTRLLLRFRALQGLGIVQRVGSRMGRPLVEPLRHTPAAAG